MSAYYNEIDLYCVQWLKNLIAARLIAPGDVDSRPIQEVTADDVRGYTQCHFFAGLGGWSHAARLAGWPDERPIWTGSCPCQPFSVAGRGKGVEDPRHLWPHLYRLIRTSRPIVIMGEQTSGAPGYAWLDGVGSDLEAEAYTWRAVDIPACSVNAPEIRNRLYWVATTDSPRLEVGSVAEVQRGAIRLEGQTVGARCAGDGRLDSAAGSRYGKARSEEMEAVRDGARRGELERRSGDGGDCRVGSASSSEWRADAEERLHVDDWADAGREETAGRPQLASAGRFWDDWQLIGPDPEGKYRRIKPGITPLDTRLSGDVGQIRAYGNAINPELAAEVIAAYMEVAA